MYSTKTGLVLGFHGCDEHLVQKVLANQEFLNPSKNTYDWLGSGIYFWESSPSRALDYANALNERRKRTKQTLIKPAVIGAVIDLGHCLDLLEYQNLQLLKEGFELLQTTLEISGLAIPANKAVGQSDDLLLRDLDCAVIETLHDVRKEANLTPFDSVRGVFFEGDELYPGAGFKEKNHIQLCIRNPNCIKGYFLPRLLDESFPKV